MVKTKGRNKSSKKMGLELEKTPKNKVASVSKKRKLLVIKLLIPIFMLIVFELVARGFSATVLKDYLAKKDLRTKLERIYIPPPEPKSDDVMRLYMYGASTTQGYPVTELGYVNQLTYQIHNVLEGKNVAVHNLGFSGNTSTMDRYVVASTFWHKPDAMIVYVSHNEFVHSEIDSIPFYRSIMKFRNSSSMFRLLMAGSQRNIKPDSVADNNENVNRKRMPYRLIKPYYALKLSILKHNYRAMAEIARSNNVPLIFITATSNIGEWPPPERTVTSFTPDGESQRDLNRIRRLIKETRLDEAKSILSEHFKQHPNDAYFLYMQGKIDELNGDYEKAKKNYEIAKNLDLLQWRANSEINNYVRSLADEKMVWVLDADKIFKKNSANGITGYSLFLDNVHPNIKGHYLLATSIIDFLKGNKIVKRDWWNNTNEYISVENFLDRIEISNDRLFDLEFLTATYCIKNPFFNFDCARDYLETSKKYRPNDWRITAAYSVVSYLENNIEDAQRLYTHAVEQHGSVINDKEALEIPYLVQVKNELIAK